MRVGLEPSGVQIAVIAEVIYITICKGSMYVGKCVGISLGMCYVKQAGLVVRRQGRKWHECGRGGGTGDQVAS